MPFLSCFKVILLILYHCFCKPKQGFTKGILAVYFQQGVNSHLALFKVGLHPNTV